MSYATVQRDIEKRLQDNWATTPIDINPNVKFTVPDYDQDYIKLRIQNDDADRRNIGAPGCHRVMGTIIIQIFINKNEGTRKSAAYGDTLAALFRDVTFNGITCREALVRDIGEFEGRWQTNLLIPFYWDGRY